MCFKFGIFIGMNSNSPTMNIMIINKVLKKMKYFNEIKEWMPAAYFLKISGVSFDTEELSEKIYSTEFEKFMSNVDIFFRVFLCCN